MEKIEKKVQDLFREWYIANTLELNKLQNKLELRAQAVRDLEDRVYELESQVDVADDKLVNSKDYTADLKAKLTKVTRECNHAYDCGLSDGEKKANETYSENTGAMARIDDLESEVRDLETKYQSSQAKLDTMNDKYVNSIDYSVDLKEKVMILQTKLKKIKRISE